MYLEDVKGLELDVPGLFLEHVHHELEVVRVGNVSCHHRKVMSVQQELAKHLQRLPPRDVVVAVQQALVLVENLPKHGHH